MHTLMMKLLRPYMAPADGEGSDLGGAADRGDVLPGDDTKGAAGDKGEAKTADDTKGAAGGDEGGDEDDEGKNTDDQPRGSDGKFAKKEKSNDNLIPKERFNEAVGKERAAREAAERRAAELEARLKREEKSADADKLEKEIEALESKHAKLLLDGKDEEAAKVMKEIRLSERKIATMEAEGKLSAAQARAVEEVRFDAAVAKLEADYPTLNPDSESFDQDIVDIVLAEQERLIRVDRMAPSAALTRAAAKIMTKFQPPATDGGQSKGLAAAKTGEDRKAAQVDKNLDTARRQPASMKDAGKDSDKAGEGKIDVTKLSPAEFAALPESTKRKLRGDDA